jgi:4-hydroxybenzoate polyprenyltransferase
MTSIVARMAVVLEMIKFQHTVFALPFAVTAMVMAAHGWPTAWQASWVIAACVFARTGAMSFNRWADRELDARNPRTATRAIPAGQLGSGFVLAFALISAAGFVLCAAMLNPLAFYLSPVALAILFGYSYAKRFTSAAHFILGMALALAPVGAWIAIRQEIGAPAVLLGLGVMLWTAGFDLIYACQDVEVDRSEGLFSVPSRMGVGFALNLARGLHVLAIGCFTYAGFLGFGVDAKFYYAGIAVATGLLLAEHLVVDPHDLRKINIAFFTINSWVGVAVMAGTLTQLML